MLSLEAETNFIWNPEFETLWLADGISQHINMKVFLITQQFDVHVSFLHTDHVAAGSSAVDTSYIQ